MSCPSLEDSPPAGPLSVAEPPSVGLRCRGDPSLLQDVWPAAPRPGALESSVEGTRGAGWRRGTSFSLEGEAAEQRPGQRLGDTRSCNIALTQPSV